MLFPSVQLKEFGCWGRRGVGLFGVDIATWASCDSPLEDLGEAGGRRDSWPHTQDAGLPWAPDKAGTLSAGSATQDMSR